MVKLLPRLSGLWDTQFSKQASYRTISGFTEGPLCSVPGTCRILEDTEISPD